MDELVSIGEFSERSGLSPKRLRTYATVGLLVPAAVDSTSGYRYYSPGQLQQAQLIDALRAAGMPLGQIGALLRDPSAGQLDEWATRVEIDAVQRQHALHLARRLLAIESASSAPVRNQHSKEASMTKLNTASCTAVGRDRDNNEDVVVTSARLAVVADGMGGHPGGEVASALAASLVQAAYTGRSLDELQAGVRAANRAIFDRAGGDAELEGMGTTICAVGVTEEGNVVIVSVGDSRAYLMRDATLRQLTSDHTVTAELVLRGELSETEAVDHPHRRVLTRALGVGPDVEPDSATHRCAPGDRLLLCSDGLFNEMPDDEIASMMTAAKDLQAIADGLVALALSRGGGDDVSAVVAEIRI
jgi:serine/threonine protein phosphatase PrpC